MFLIADFLIALGSEEWNAVSDQQKKDLGLQLEKDGEFWMSFDDFVG